MKQQQAIAVLEDLLRLQGLDAHRTADRDDEEAEYLDLLIQRLVRDDPIAIPVTARGWSGYYLAARHPEALHAYMQVTASWCDPGFGQLNPLPPAQGHDVVADAIAAAGYPHLMRLTLREATPARALRVQLLAMHRLLEQRPPLQIEGARPLAYLLRDFEWAIAHGDSSQAATALRAVATDGGLSDDNLRFLQVRNYAAFGRWAEIWSSGLMEYLLAVRRPRLVSDLLLRALWLRYFSGNAHDVGAMMQTLRDQVLPAYAPLFASGIAVTSPEARRVIALYALTDPARVDLVTKLQTEVADDPSLGLILDAAPGQIADAEALEPLALAEAALDEAQYDRVCALLRDVTPTSASVSLLVRAAFHLNDPEYAVLTFRAFQGLDKEQHASLLDDTALRRMVDVLAAVAGPVITATERLPESWQAWLSVVEGDPAWPSALEVARRGAQEWAVDGISNEAAAENFYSSALDATEEVRRVLVQAAPYLDEFAQRMPAGNAALLLSKTVFDVLVLDEHSSVADLMIAAQILDRILSLGPGSREYGQLLDDAGALWRERLGSYDNLDWGLGVVDSLARAASSNPAARLRFLTDVSLVIHRSASRLLIGERAYAVDLFRECDAEALIAALPAPAAEVTVSGEDLWIGLRTQTVGIHCLFEPIVKRFASVLPQVAPGVQIDSDASHDCSPHLRAMCQAADIVVLVTQHAKHAGTECVLANVGPTTAVVRSRGNRVGFTGVYRALQSHMESLRPPE